MNFKMITFTSLLSLSLLAPSFAMADASSKYEMGLERMNQGSRSGMALCEKSSDKLVNIGYSIKFEKLPSGLVKIIAVDPKKQTVLGTVSKKKIAKLNPMLRRAASAANTGLIVGGGIASVGAVSLGGLGVAFSGYTTGAVAGMAGGSIGAAAVVGAQFIDVLNPVHQWERASLEKCLQRTTASSAKVSQIVMTRSDDYKDTVKGLKDLIHDLNKPVNQKKIVNSDRSIAFDKSAKSSSHLKKSSLTSKQ